MSCVVLTQTEEAHIELSRIGVFTNEEMAAGLTDAQDLCGI